MKEHILKKAQLTDVMELTDVNLFEEEVVELRNLKNTISDLNIQVFCDNTGFFRLLDFIEEGRIPELIDEIKSTEWEPGKTYVFEADGKIHQY